MIEIITSPKENGLYATADIPKLEFYCEGTASVLVLMDGLSPFPSRYVPDKEGYVEIDFRDILSEITFSKFPTTSDMIEQSEYLRNVLFIISDSNDAKMIPFTVANIHCSVIGPLSQMFTERFLTRQPLVKYVTTKSKEYLTLNNTSDSAALMVRFYSNAGGETVTFSQLKNGVSTYDVSPPIVIKKSSIPSSNRKAYYDIYVSVPKDGVYKKLFSQRYVIKDSTDAEKYYIFENELGGFDTMICNGILLSKTSITYNTAKISSGVVPLDDVDDKIVYEQKSGYFPSIYKEWAKSLLFSKRQKYFYDPENNVFKKIVFVDSSYEVNDRDGVFYFSFSYINAEREGGVVHVGKPLPVTSQMVTSAIGASMGDELISKTTSVTPLRGGGYASEKIECTSEKMLIQMVADGEVRIFTSIDGDTWTLFDVAQVEGSTVRPYERLTVGSFLKVESDNAITMIKTIAV